MKKITCSVTGALAALKTSADPSLIKYHLHITTGDCVGSGTNSNIYVILHGDDNAKSEETKLERILGDSFEKGKTDKFTVKTNKVKSVKKIEIWRDKALVSHKWFLDGIRVVNCSSCEETIFPFRDWITAHFHYVLLPYDTFLPQDDPRHEQRRIGLENKRSRYQLTEKYRGAPPVVKCLPAEEIFAFDYLWDIGTIAKKSLVTGLLNTVVTGHWKKLTDIANVYTCKIFTAPSSLNTWTHDESFGLKRLASLNSSLIKLCTGIPEKFGVTEEMIAPFLEGMSLKDAIEKKKLFMVDLEILQGAITKTRECRVCAPIALFYANKVGILKPIGIQLFQEKGQHNPVFLPSDPHYVWLFAKMWFNNADANLHESATHLGYTHFVMEGIIVVTHRNLSLSHPLFKVLAPHFLYLLAINTAAGETLISKDGWVDKVTSVGRIGMMDLITKMKKIWRMDVHGTLPADLEERGVDDPSILPEYHYREDGLLLYHAIHNYISKYVALYYDDSNKIMNDCELQAWADALSRCVEEGGCGILGVPGGGKFTNQKDIVTTVTSIIYTASVTHAAVNFPQYDEYAYPPNYPLQLSGEPPVSKAEISEGDILKALPSKSTTIDTIVITNILSTRGTQPLGDFEVQYIVDPKALKIVEEFREELKIVGAKIVAANKERRVPYNYLHPDHIPNAISI